MITFRNKVIRGFKDNAELTEAIKDGNLMKKLLAVQLRDEPDKLIDRFKNCDAISEERRLQLSKFLAKSLERAELAIFSTGDFDKAVENHQQYIGQGDKVLEGSGPQFWWFHEFAAETQLIYQLGGREVDSPIPISYRCESILFFPKLKDKHAVFIYIMQDLAGDLYPYFFFNQATGKLTKAMAICAACYQQLVRTDPKELKERGWILKGYNIDVEAN